LYPILFRLWSFPITTYGVFLALAFLGAIFVTVKLAGRDGLPRERIYDLCLWLRAPSLIGSDTFFVVAAGRFADRLEAFDVLYRARVSRASAATLLSGLSALWRCLLWWLDR